MPDFKYCVIALASVNVTLFCIFCFLMSTVNPEPSASNQASNNDSSTEASTKASTEGGLDDPVAKLMEAPKPNEEPGIIDLEDPTNRRMLPEIKKNIDGSNTDNLNDSKNIILRSSNVTTKKSIYHRIFEILNNNLAPPSTVRRNSTNIHSALVDRTSLTTIHYPVKGLRRSVNTEDDLQSTDVKSDSVLLKIMDHFGYPKIEIKLISVKDSPEKKIGDENKHKSKVELNMYVQENDSLSVSGSVQSNLPNNSVIQFMPTKTLTVNNDSYITAKAIESSSVFSKFDETIGSSDSNKINVAESSDVPTDTPIFIETENVTVFLADRLDMTESNNYLETTVGDSVAGLEDVADNESKQISQDSVMNMKALYDQASDVSEKPNTYENISNIMQADDEEVDEHDSFNSTVSSENVIVSSYLADLVHSENMNLADSEHYSDNINNTDNISSTKDSQTLLITDVVYENDSLADSEHYFEKINKTENISSTKYSQNLLISDVVYENDSSIELTTPNSE